MGGGPNVFKVTLYIEKYVRFFITDEVDKCFATSCNSQVVLEILEIFKKTSASVHLKRLQINS